VFGCSPPHNADFGGGNIRQKDSYRIEIGCAFFATFFAQTKKVELFGHRVLNGSLMKHLDCRPGDGPFAFGFYK
jgi:hypothetical protein